MACRDAERLLTGFLDFRPTDSRLCTIYRVISFGYNVHLLQTRNHRPFEIRAADHRVRKSIRSDISPIALKFVTTCVLVFFPKLYI